MTTDPERTANVSNVDEGEDGNNDVGFKVNLSGRPMRTSAILRSTDGAILGAPQHLSAQGLDLEVLQYFFMSYNNLMHHDLSCSCIHHM